jgi:hypothetical protein
MKGYFCLGVNSIFILIAFACLSCSAPTKKISDCTAISDEQLDWLRKRGYSKRVEGLPCEKRVEIAKFIQNELDLSDELDSLVDYMDASQENLPDSLKVVVTR